MNSNDSIYTVLVTIIGMHEISVHNIEKANLIKQLWSIDNPWLIKNTFDKTTSFKKAIGGKN